MRRETFVSRSLTVAVWLAAGCAGCGQGDLGATAPMEPMTSHDGGGAPMPVDHDGGTTPVMMMMDPCPRVRVTIHGDTLNLRSGPTLDSRILTTLDEGTIVTVVGVEHGDDVDGEDRWYEIDTHENRGYVTAYFVTCTSEPETFGPFDGFRLPLACGMSARISQGNNTTFSHQGLSAWASISRSPSGRRSTRSPTAS